MSHADVESRASQHAEISAAPRFGAWKEGEEAVFRIWAPALDALRIEIDGVQDFAMTPLGEGWFEYRAPLPFGTRYRYRLPDGLLVPDPASRRQEGGVHGQSVLTSSEDYRWRCNGWRGRPWRETIVYELHPGLLGGFAGIERELARLAELGVTAVELMPIADFPGRRSWGYDGVLQFAPAAAYGTAAELKSLIDRAHELGLSVLLDVVFNHFGPDGCYLHALAPQFFDDVRQTPWGAGIDFDRPEVRAFYRACALQWLDEFRFDGLRLDAVHAIPSADFLLELERDIRRALPADRHVHLVVENEDNDADLLDAYDAQWNDDFHHAVHVLLTGETQTYYAGFAPEPIRHLARILESGFAYQGEVSPSRGGPRGQPSGHLAPTRFVNCLQNHDQIGNRLFGERLLALADPEKVKAAAALLLLAPQIPMLFMGEEIGSRTPFYYFTDHNEELAQAVREGRKREFAHEDHDGDPLALDPNAPQTFEASRPRDGEDSEIWLMLYRKLIEIRRDEIIPHLDDCRSTGATPIGSQAVMASWTLSGRQLVLLANFADEPVTAPLPDGRALFSLGIVKTEAQTVTLGRAAFLAVLSE
jgi:maltooligosyltrehalose trehalohydrolase